MASMKEMYCLQKIFWLLISKMAANEAEITFIDSNKGGRKLFYQGFSYTKRNTGSVYVYWACSERDMYTCNGTLKTLLDLSNPEVSSSRISAL